MSQPSSQTLFVPSSIDTRNERLVSGDRDISLTLKSYAVLKYLTERAGQLVTKDELLNALWPQTFCFRCCFLFIDSARTSNVTITNLPANAFGPPSRQEEL